MHTARLRRVLIALTAATLLLTGCSDEPSDPAALPPKTPTPSVSASPSSGAEPELEVKPEPETAEEFIRTWARLSQEMQVSGETQTFRDLSATCEVCLSYADRVDRIYRRGGFIRTKGWRVDNVVAPTGKPKGRVLCLIDVMARPTTYKDRKEGPVKRYSGGPLQMRFDLRYQKGRWWILKYDEATR